MNWVSFLILGCVLCLSAPHANAGAWPRGKDKTFVASSATLTWPDKRELELPDIYGASYLEHGISARLTMGLDMGSPDATRPERLKTVGFLRYTFTPQTSPVQLAIDGGGGRYLGTDVARVGLAYGLGFKSFSKNSWIAVDAHALRSVRDTRTAYSFDATYGVALSGGKAMAQISAFQAFDEIRTIKLTPSYAHDLGLGRHLEIGVVLGLRAKPDPVLKIGIWQEF